MGKLSVGQVIARPKCRTIMNEDIDGFTPIHLLLCTNRITANCTAKALLSCHKLRESTARANGLTHLHVASWFNDTAAVERLIAHGGSDIEAKLSSTQHEKFAKFAGWTALHLSIENRSVDTARMLMLQCGADVFAKRPDFHTAASEILRNFHDESELLSAFMKLIMRETHIQIAMWAMYPGMTLLHLACHSLDVNLAKNWLNDIDQIVDARIGPNSLVWPGCTPLNVLVKIIPTLANREDGKFANERKKKFELLLELLLARGADVTAATVGLASPLQCIFDGMINGCDIGSYLLHRHKDFKVNPTDLRGISYFHLACLSRDSIKIGRFLAENCGGIDLDRPITSTNDNYHENTPLHLATRPTSIYRSSNLVVYKEALSILCLLLEHGAEPFPRDSDGNTPLHNVVNLWHFTERTKAMEKLIGLVKDWNIPNRIAQTPFELLLYRFPQYEELRMILVDENIQMNQSIADSDEGYMAMIFAFTQLDSEERTRLLKLVGVKRLLVRDKFNRNAIHNCVNARRVNGNPTELHSLLKKLIRAGCDIDQPDFHGKTPLHLAAQFANVEAVVVLLELGADVNALDSLGHTSFSSTYAKAGLDDYATDNDNYRRVYVLGNIFVKLFRNFEYLNLEIDIMNKIMKEAIGAFADISFNDDISQQYRETKSVRLGLCNRNLSDFICETGIISVYPSITPLERKEISKFFDNEDNFVNFRKLGGILRFQFNKCKDRLSLANEAMECCNTFFCIPITDLCSRNIIKYLSNGDLKRLLLAEAAAESNMIVDS